MNKPQVLILDNAQLAARKAADLIANQVREKPASVLGLATGSTPERTYARLVEIHRAGLPFSGVRTFNLDEYLGLSPDHPQSYRYFMNQHLFQHLDIKLESTHILDGLAEDPDVECANFENQISECGGVDLWLLGIGQNGHIAFNEPGSEVTSRTRIVQLAESTIAANSDGRFFDDPADVPRYALTAGIETILDSRRLVLLATGSGKAGAVKQALLGPKSNTCPASLITDHADCTFVLDSESASLL